MDLMLPGSLPEPSRKRLNSILLGLGGTRSVEVFGAKGDGVSDNTAALTRAHAWLEESASAGVAAGLIYPGGEYRITDEIPLPDASGWSLESQGYVTITQATDNKMIWSMKVSAARSRFSIGRGGGSFRFKWANTQPATNTRAVAIALGSTVEVTDGLFDFYIGPIVIANGYRGIAIHPDMIGAGFRFPIWGFVMENVTSFRTVSGSTICIYSDNPNTGMPRAEIRNFYAQGQNALEPRLRIEGIDQLKIGNAEFNLGSGNQMLLSNNRQIIIDNLRLEQASTAVDFDRIFTVSGSTSQCIVRNLEIQTHAVNVATECYVLTADASVIHVENFEVIDITTTSGRLYILNSAASGVVTYEGDAVFSNENLTNLHSVGSAPNVLPANRQEYSFSKSAIAASTAATAIPNGKDGNLETIGGPAYLIGIYVKITSPLTGGTVTVTANKNGGGIASGQFSAVLSTGLDAVSRYHPCWKGFFSPGNSHKFVAGDFLSFSYATSAAFAPSGTLRVVAIMAHVPR